MHHPLNQQQMLLAGHKLLRAVLRPHEDHQSAVGARQGGKQQLQVSEETLLNSAASTPRRGKAYSNRHQVAKPIVPQPWDHSRIHHGGHKRTAETRRLALMGRNDTTASAPCRGVSHGTIGSTVRVFKIKVRPRIPLRARLTKPSAHPAPLPNRRA